MHLTSFHNSDSDRTRSNSNLFGGCWASNLRSMWLTWAFHSTTRWCLQMATRDQPPIHPRLLKGLTIEELLKSRQKIALCFLSIAVIMPSLLEKGFHQRAWVGFFYRAKYRGQGSYMSRQFDCEIRRRRRSVFAGTLKIFF